MFPQFDPAQARFVAELIVSILGVLLLLMLVVWMIRRKQKGDSNTLVSSGNEPITISDFRLAGYEDLNPLTFKERLERRTTLNQAYQTWKTERLLQGEDGRSLFVRSSVEKSGLRYQLVASTQVQALAILISAMMAESDSQASAQAEALFASLLAHPAYLQNELSSWKYLPDLPRSPKLDPDPHAEAWVIFAMTIANKRWPAINRFHYAEIIQERLHALQKYTEALEPEQIERLPFSGYLVKQLFTLDPSLDWTALSKSNELFYAQLEEQTFFGYETDTSRLGLSLLQLGLLALSERDAEALRAIDNSRSGLVQFVEDYSKDSSIEIKFSRSAMLACAVPILLTLQDKDLIDQVWNELVSLQPGKNDGLGATLRVLGMAFLANQQI